MCKHLTLLAAAWASHAHAEANERHVHVELEMELLLPLLNGSVALALCKSGLYWVWALS